ncbi:hypothetical protein [Mesorhizobium sp. M7A.F.Ca.CA.004.02.1.1]|uniref:hypothetical protein n=1 Tax=Mesorhizobium sp. M7A.F.Ca.CA.004.02.1.1 TaxID=2496690 RepID=UPI000FCBFFCC|nr:hypothetical protein [Mesorhizobium sp. M7A.F.Ca.CA.004.02.1.1]RVB05676.1 hypothetical protein EN912_02115 [Mesorhizobium sp. M7A.F.Ca.CA.004.02.1.1]
MSRHLFHKDGRPVKQGDDVTSFRGEPYIVTGWEQTGRNRVYVKAADEVDIVSFYVGVFDLSWDKPA